MLSYNILGISGKSHLWFEFPAKPICPPDWNPSLEGHPKSLIYSWLGHHTSKVRCWSCSWENSAEDELSNPLLPIPTFFGRFRGPLIKLKDYITILKQITRGRLRDLYTINCDRGRGIQKSWKLGWHHLYMAPYSAESADPKCLIYRVSKSSMK